MADRLKQRAWLLGHVDHRGDDCILWPFSLDTKGYAQVCIGKSTVRKASRVMCELAHGSPPTIRHQAAHSCRNRHCINPRHLSWKTQSENEADKKRDGTVYRNKHGRRPLLTPDQIRLIQTTRGNAVGLAKQFGVQRETIHWWRRKTNNSPKSPDKQPTDSITARQ